MTIRSDLVYIEWIKSTTDNLDIIDYIEDFNGNWPRQFIFRLLYKHEKDLNKIIVKNIKFYLGIRIL